MGITVRMRDELAQSTVPGYCQLEEARKIRFNLRLSLREPAYQHLEGRTLYVQKADCPKVLGKQDSS